MNFFLTGKLLWKSLSLYLTISMNHLECLLHYLIDA